MRNVINGILSWCAGIRFWYRSRDDPTELQTLYGRAAVRSFDSPCSQKSNNSNPLSTTAANRFITVGRDLRYPHVCLQVCTSLWRDIDEL